MIGDRRKVQMAQALLLNALVDCETETESTYDLVKACKTLCGDDTTNAALAQVKELVVELAGSIDDAKAGES
jgi:hypothetical protein